MNIELHAQPPFSLNSVIHSHGWARLAPFNTLDVEGALSYIYHLGNHQVIEIRISKSPIGVYIDIQEEVPPESQEKIKSAATWMLALNECFEEFYKLAKSEPKLSHVEGKAQGRLLRSPTLFEDTVKTILTTNTSWAGTIRMTK